MTTREEDEAARAHRELVSSAKATTTDLFALLDLASQYSADPQPAPSDDQIKKAFKKAALRYHPDKNRGKEDWAAQKYDECSRARDILLDSEARAAYESKLASELENRKRHAALDERKRHMVEDLLKREDAAAVARGTKRPSEEELEHDAKAARIHAETRRRLQLLTEKKRREWEEANKAREDAQNAHKAPQEQQVMDECYRSVKIRWVTGTPDAAQVDKDMIMAKFQKFGDLQAVAVLKDKKALPSRAVSASEKKAKKVEMGNALVVFKSIVGAQAAVAKGVESWPVIDSVIWIGGKETNSTSPRLDSTKSAPVKTPSGTDT